jgi:signal transduction histidine kinase
METLHFRISSGLKNIIGRELINNKYIAIFELVKNSYDAGASFAKIRFDNLGKDDASISISDDGMGMDRDAIIQKWLFVAYSEKRNPSYRDQIKRSVAGAKGVGRFSCDRLGSKVMLSSKTKGDRIRHTIAIDWDDFERSSKDNFSDIDVQYSSADSDEDSAGTEITISSLREEWTRNDLLSLKKALSQLVNPNATAEYDPFRIILEVPSELENDSQKTEIRDKVNGEVSNNIYNEISNKTTKIEVDISNDGRTITTTMTDRGVFLFKTVEKNEFTLSDISCTLFFLNRSAKLFFTKQMGVEAINYGSVFVYKNGFRVYPYGEPGQDFFDVDQRKQQGYKRYLGTRELIGKIVINGDKNDLVETSSRNNGFIASSHLEDLKLFFFEYALRPLEKYVTQIMQWGVNDELFDGQKIENLFDSLDLVVKKIKTRTKQEAYLSNECNQSLAQSIIDKSKTPSPVDELRILAEQEENKKLIDKAKEIARREKELQKQAELARREAEKAQEALESKTAELETTKKQIGILSARADLTAQDAINAMHIMKGYAETIDSLLFEVYQESEDRRIDISGIRLFLDDMGQVCKKLMNSYNLVMRTSYSADSDYVNGDIVSFIQKYCEEFHRTLKVSIEKPAEELPKIRFNPLEFSVIIDNLIDNSCKANASEMVISFSRVADHTRIRCVDNGYGIKKEADPSRMFEAGYSTTNGSGIGLSTVRKYIEKTGGSVRVNSEYTHGFEIIMEI